MRITLYACMAVCMAGQVMGQVNPPAQSLPYTENFNSLTGSSTSLPTGWAPWVAAGSTGTFPTSGPTGAASFSGGTAATTASGTYDYNGKAGILNSGSSSNALAMAINTTGLGQINVAYDAMTIRDPYNGSTNTRVNVFALQYRVGTSGSWTTLLGSRYYSNATTNTSGTTAVNIQPRSVLLPANCNNQPEVQLRWVNKDSTGGGQRPSFAIDNVNITGQPASTNLVNLTLSSASGFEGAQTVITVTASASNIVSNVETVTLSVTGNGITPSDYALSAPTITIASGSNSGTVNFTVQNDLLNEGTETAFINIANLSAGLASGSVTSLPVTITDDDTTIVLSGINLPSNTQNFDLLNTTGTGQNQFPFGVFILEQTSSTNANVDGLYRAGDGSTSTGDVYSFGTGTNSDRALGSVSSGSFSPTYIGLQLQNSTGQTFNSLDITYVGEQWRDGGNSGGDSLVFEYSTDAISLATGTWQRVNALKFNSPVQSGVAGALNGDLPANRTIISSSLTNLGNISPGATIWVRWIDFDVVGNDHGMAVDSFVAIPRILACPEPTQPVATLTTSNLTGSSVQLNWTGGNGTNVAVVARLGNPVSDAPVDGQNYTAASAFGTPTSALGSGFVVYAGPAASGTVNVTNLVAGNTYHFAAYSYDCNPGEYNTTTPAVTQAQIPVIPAITVTPTTLGAFTAQANSNSNTDSVTVSGVNLVASISLTTNAPFEISTAFAGPYSTSISLPPLAGVVNNTRIYVRMLANAANTYQDTLFISSQGVTTVKVVLNGTTTASGTFPNLHPLCSSNYTFSQWDASSAAGTYPASMSFHTTSTMDPNASVSMTGTYAAAYNLTGGSRINGIGADGLSFANTGTASNGGHLGTAVLGLNTLGRTNIEVSWLNGIQSVGSGTPTPRDYRMRLEYRVGGNAWQVVPGTEYQTIGLAQGTTQNFGPIVLPSDAENQPVVYLQWRYFQQASNNGGSRPAIRLDEISVTSTGISAGATDLVAVAASETDTLFSTLTGSVNTNTDGAQIFAFTIRDGGANGVTDNLPTELSAMQFTAGSLHTAGAFNQVFQAVALFDGSTKLADGVLTANSLDFTGLSLQIPDGNTQTLQLRATLSSAGQLIDKTNIQLSLTNAGVTLTNPCNSSPMTTVQILSDGTMNAVEVSATDFVFTGISQPITASQPFTLTVQAVDQLMNIDTDPRTITLTLATGSGNLSSTAGLGPVSMINGQFTWTDLVYDVVGAFTVNAQDPASSVNGDTLLNANPLCVTPSNATGLAFSNITSTDLTVQWQNGSGTGRILVVRQGAPVATGPTDGQTYTANSVFGTPTAALGDGFVVYSGNGTTTNISGLTANTLYHFALYEFDCTPVKYASGETASQATANVGIASNEPSAFHAYPNPAEAGTPVYFNQSVHAALFDLSGRQMKVSQQKGMIATEGLPTGVYILRTEDGEAVRIVITR